MAKITVNDRSVYRNPYPNTLTIGNIDKRMLYSAKHPTKFIHRLLLVFQKLQIKCSRKSEVVQFAKNSKVFLPVQLVEQRGGPPYFSAIIFESVLASNDTDLQRPHVSSPVRRVSSRGTPSIVFAVKKHSRRCTLLLTVLTFPRARPLDLCTVHEQSLTVLRTSSISSISRSPIFLSCHRNSAVRCVGRCVGRCMQSIEFI